uniref:DNA-directed RNA polymerase n=1 Tax=Clandestinovirus TaxID=2831644 RepID=A0A8F8KP99_9VIRU|nr:DNA-directed RNA polymerase II subunit 2 [Clandestinovirus]
MGKQAIGTPTLNTAFRTDTISYQLWYPQSPLVTTRAGKYLMHNETLAAGQNVVFAIASWTGYNQDDSTMINQSAIDRGLFRSFIRRSIYVDTKKQPSNSFETFEKPNPNEVVGMKHGNYDKLDEDGFVAPGTYIQENDVIVGKTQPPPASVTKQAKNKYRGSTLETLETGAVEKDNEEQDEETKKSCKSILHTGKPAYVENVVVGNTPQGGKYGRVTTIETHIPAISDKFSSRHGQKGTMGMAYPQHDMPFSADGISPDVIMNPHGLTSRMTIGQLKEGIFGMIAALSGKIVDGTPFYEYYGIDTRGKTESEVDEMLFSPKLKPGQTIMDATYDLLKSYGYERKGKQQLYDGRTGEPFECETFHCMVYYQALRHLGSEKKHARARGRRQTITKQPAEGRSRDGGLRFGEMERDAIIGHGASNLLVERLHYNSDPSEFYVCDSCGSIGVGEAFVDENGSEYTLARCTYCVHSNMKLCRAPNALKSLFQELGGGNINSSIWV